MNELDVELVESIQEMIDEADDEIEDDEYKEAFGNAFDEIADNVYNDIRNDFSAVEQQRKELKKFRERLDDDWGGAIDLLELLVVRCTALANQINRELTPRDDDDYLFHAYVHLHSRACQISNEIVTLLRAGFPDGALSRWRSLHEIAAVMIFINDNVKEGVPERFIKYLPVATKQFAEEYDEHYEELGYEPLEDGTLEQLEERIEELENEYGEQFSSTYHFGWAIPGFPDGNGRMRKIREEAGLMHFQPYFRLASDSLHSGPRGTFNRVGSVNLPPELSREVEQVAAGPVNAGLSDPGQLTAITIQLATSAFIQLYPAPSVLLELKVNNRIVDEIDELFASTEDEIRQREIEVREEEQEMDIVDIVHVFLGGPDLFTDELIDEYTEYSTVEKFVDAAPVQLDEATNKEPRQELDEFVDDCSREFQSYRELIDEVMLEFIRKEEIRPKNTDDNTSVESDSG